MYFESMPSIFYSLDGKSVQAVSDIITRIQINSAIKDNIDIYRRYEIKDGETPEMVSHKIYGNSQYHWVILITNEILDPLTDWYVSGQAFENLLNEKYENPDETAFFEDVDGVVVDADSSAFAYFPISYRVLEERLNDQKRFIKILDPQLVNAFVDEYKKLMGAV